MLQPLQRLACALSPARGTLSRVLVPSCKLADSKGISAGSQAAQAEISAKIPKPADQEFDRYDKALSYMNDTELARRRAAGAAQRVEPEGVPLDRPIQMADIELELDRDEGAEMALAEMALAEGLPLPRAPVDLLGRPVDMEFDYDRDDPECISMEDLYNPKARAALEEVLGRPVDIEQEFDRDDLECVDLEELYSTKAKAAVMEALGRPVELDDDYDMMHDQATESPSSTMAGNVDMRTGQKAGSEGVGQYRERGTKFNNV